MAALRALSQAEVAAFYRVGGLHLFSRGFGWVGCACFRVGLVGWAALVFAWVWLGGLRLFSRGFGWVGCACSRVGLVGWAALVFAWFWLGAHNT